MACLDLANRSRLQGDDFGAVGPDLEAEQIAAAFRLDAVSAMALLLRNYPSQTPTRHCLI